MLELNMPLQGQYVILQMVLQLFSYVTWGSFSRWQSNFGSCVPFQQPSTVTNPWFRVVDDFNSLHMVRTVLWSWVSNVIIRTTEEETVDVHQIWRMLLCFKIHKNLAKSVLLWAFTLIVQYTFLNLFRFFYCNTSHETIAIFRKIYEIGTLVSWCVWYNLICAKSPPQAPEIALQGVNCRKMSTFKPCLCEWMSSCLTLPLERRQQ